MNPDLGWPLLILLLSVSVLCLACALYVCRTGRPRYRLKIHEFEAEAPNFEALANIVKSAAPLLRRVTMEQHLPSTKETTRDQ